MDPGLSAIRDALTGSEFEGKVFLVGGAVRDGLLGRELPTDFDLVSECSVQNIVRYLHKKGILDNPPVTYERFGTAMISIGGSKIELVTARRESYRESSRKPAVEAASLLEDTLRRDFTINTLMRNLWTDEVIDLTGHGLRDLETGILRTPTDAMNTFHDDPLRMLRAIRFRRKLGLAPAEGLLEAIQVSAGRLKVVSAERIRDELMSILALARADLALADLMDLGLLEVFAPELKEMVGVEQGSYHHLDVWHHTLLVVKSLAGASAQLKLAGLLHDVGKPETRTIDANSQTRFLGHEAVGASITRRMLRRLKFSDSEVERVVILVKNHMRLGSMVTFSETAARRLIRDMGDAIPDLLRLVEADANGLKPGVRTFDLGPIRAVLAEVQVKTPSRDSLRSPLTGAQIMAELGLERGPEVGRLKAALLDMVLEGKLAPSDEAGALNWLREAYPSPANKSRRN